MSGFLDQIGTAGGQLSGLLVAGLLAVSCSRSAVPTSPDVALAHAAPVEVEAGASLPAAGLEAQLVERINQYRARKLKRPLVRHAGLDEIAQRHTEAMMRSGRLSHDGFKVRAKEGTERFGKVWMTENVAWGSGHADSRIVETILQNWIESKEHKKNLLYPNREIGVSVLRSADGSFWATQLSARDRY